MVPGAATLCRAPGTAVGRLVQQVREITRRPEVQGKVEQLKDTARNQVTSAAERANPLTHIDSARRVSLAVARAV